MSRWLIDWLIGLSFLLFVFAFTLIWLGQNYLQPRLCLVIWMIAIHFCMVSPTLTSRNFSVFRIDWPAWWQSHPHILTVLHCFVPFIGYPSNLEYCSRAVCWPTKRFMKNSLFIFTPCLSHHSNPIHWDQAKELVCPSLGSRPGQVQELFTLVPSLFGTACRCLSIQPFPLLPSRNIWRHISSTWPFPHRRQHALQVVDVTELLHRFGCWTPIPLSHHWAWLRLAYWHYRNLIDWLIKCDAQSGHSQAKNSGRAPPCAFPWIRDCI